MSRLLLALCAVWLATVPAAAQDAALPLEPGKPFSGAIGTVEESPIPDVLTFRVAVPPDCLGIRLELEAQGDLDLFLSDEPIEDFENDPLLAAVEDTGAETLQLHRDLDPPLETGVYFVTVAYLREEAPRLRSGRSVRAIPFKLSLLSFSARVDGVLAVGGAVRAVVEPAAGPFRTYTVEVTKDLEAVRLDLIGQGADLNLRVRYRRPMIDMADADAFAESLLSSEVLVLDASSDPPLRSGTLYVDVIEPVGLDWPVPFELRCQSDAKPPADLLRMPPLPVASTPVERALLATVELLAEESGGSGVLVSPQGHLITNYHVVQQLVESRGRIGGPLFVGVTLDLHGSPTPLFQAEVLAADAELDLALCRCTVGRYGQPLPEGYRFPTVGLADTSKLAHGDPLLVLGYPSAGVYGTLATATLTRGIVSGFELRGRELHLKTDAEINAGNSGGAALNGDFELVGFPTETIADEGGNGQLGFVRPVWLVPRAWWETAGLTGVRVSRPGR